MKKKIAIFEIEYHLHFVKTLVELIDLNKNSVTIFTTRENLNDLKIYLGNNIKKVKIKIPKKSLLNFLFSFYKSSNKYDLCFHFSVQSHFLLLPFRYLLFPKCKTILVTFRVENYLGNLFDKKLKNIGLKLYIINAIFNFIRFQIAKKSNSIITNGFRDTNILKKKFLEKSFYEIPYAVNKETSKYKYKNKITIGVPGSIDKIRRDYIKILKFFESLKEFKNEFSLILIGSFSSNKPGVLTKKDKYFNKIVKEIEILKSKGFDIIYFSKKLSQSEYIKYIKKSDIMLTYMNLDSYMDHGWTSVYTESIYYNKYLLTNRKNSPKNISFLENYFSDEISFKKKLKNFKYNKNKIYNKNRILIDKYFGYKKYSIKLSSIIENTIKN